MKKILTLIAMCTFMCCALLGCKCEHEWKEADCISPKTCTACEETEGEPLGHNWITATCTKPDTCSRCEETRGTSIEHKWVDANCTAPKTCTVCGETQGEALGHQESDWIVVNKDMVSATEVLEKHCTVCDEWLDKKEHDMESLHNTYRFVITPNEFVSRMNNELQSIEGSNLIAVSGTSGEYFACVIMNIDTAEIAASLLFVGDGESIDADKEDEVCFDGCLGSISNDGESIAMVLISIIQACDPSLSFSEAKEVGSEVLYNSESTHNGITYIYTYTDDSVIVAFTLTE